jgi:hypothetical protein
MRLTEEELKEFQRQRTARSRRAESDCPPEEVLLRAAVLKATREERGRLLDHLRSCSDCSREYQVARMTASWVEDAAGGILPSTGGGEDRRSRFASWFPFEFGRWIWATCLLLSVALGFWIIRLNREQLEALERLKELLARQPVTSIPRPAQADAQSAELRRQIVELSQPQVNVQIVDLDPGDVVRGKNRSQTLDVPGKTQLITLILHTGAAKDYASYELEIRDSQGKTTWTQSGLQRSREGTFSIAFRVEWLAPGKNELRLFGYEPGRKDLVEAYRLEIRGK